MIITSRLWMHHWFLFYIKTCQARMVGISKIIPMSILFNSICFFLMCGEKSHLMWLHCRNRMLQQLRPKSRLYRPHAWLSSHKFHFMWQNHRVKQCHCGFFQSDQSDLHAEEPEAMKAKVDTPCLAMKPMQDSLSV